MATVVPVVPTMGQSHNVSMSGTRQFCASQEFQDRVMVACREALDRANIPNQVLHGAKTIRYNTYDDAARKATFRIKAHLNSPDGDITADHIVVSLAKDDNSVERLEAEGALTLKETDRITTGEKVVYVLADNESYTVTGKPAKMVAKGCHVNTGTTLNFEKSTDKLRIDGNDETRTQTKTEGKCIESHD